MAILKQIVDYNNMLIVVEGARLLREKRLKGDPTGANMTRRLLDRQRKATESNRQV
jgi:hypothetical protein